MTICGLSLAVWSRAGRQHMVPLFPVLSSQPVFCCPLCGSPSWVPHRTVPPVRLTIMGSPQDSALSATHHHGFPTGQCPLCGSPSWVPHRTVPQCGSPSWVTHRTVPSARLTIMGSPQDSAFSAAHHHGFPTGQCLSAAHHHGFPTGQSLTEAQQEAREGATPTYTTSSMTSQLGKTYATSSGHHNRVKPPLTPHRRACGGAWHCPLACFVVWHHHHCPLVSPPFWDGPGESSHTDKEDNNVRQEENDNTGYIDYKFNQKHKESDTSHNKDYKFNQKHKDSDNICQVYKFRQKHKENYNTRSEWVNKQCNGAERDVRMIKENASFVM